MRRALVLLALFLFSCGPGRKGPVGPSSGRFVLADELAHLKLPVVEGTAGSLARIDDAAEAGDVDAAWAYAHYLIDLFDWSRVQDDGEARKVLFGAVKIEAARGSEVTDRVLDALLVSVDRVTALERLHAGALAARVLLELDRNPPKGRSEIFSRMTALKGVARGGGPLAANANLRLAWFCEQAFRDAVRAPTPDRPRIVSYCLYPLYDSDPEPYLVEDPARRPPLPSWRDLADGARGLYEAVGNAGSRIGSLGALRITLFNQFLEAAQKWLPTPRRPDELGAPMVSRAPPYDWTPLLHLGDGSTLTPASELAERLRPVLALDGRGRVAVAIASTAPARKVLLHGAQVALSAGAADLELVVGAPQELKVPPGDYWHGKTAGGKVHRLGVLPLSLDVIAQGAAHELQRDAPRAVRWDATRARLGLHLVVSARKWQIVSPGGGFPAVSSEDGAAALRKQLTDIRRAYPDEDGLVVVAEADATYAGLVQAVVAARTGGDGAPLFAVMALGRDAPSGKGDLAERVKRRAAVTVTVSPEVLAPRVPALRRCYLMALERNPRLSGTVVLERVDGAGGGLAATSGPRDDGLRRCLADRLADLVEEHKVKSTRIELSP